ncbi:hypothetical protein O988_09461, partial [Pseudogymnoascus sp. VKM F-3808]
EREPFVQAAKRTPVDLREWAVSLMEKHNRRSHLAPQLSPATQELLRSSDAPSSSPATTSSATTTTTPSIPTSSSSLSNNSSSGDIPITTDPRMNAISPREQVVNTINGIRSPTKPPPPVPTSSSTTTTTASSNSTSRTGGQPRRVFGRGA